MVVVGIRNTQGQLGTLLVGDFTGTPNFFYWVVALFIIGAFGYINELKAPSDAMLALVIIAILLSNRGFFAQFTAQLQAGSSHAPPPGPPNPTAGSSPTSSTPSQSAGGGGNLSALTSVAAIGSAFL